MEIQTDSKTPRKIYADKLCKDAVVCVLFGIFLFVFCIFIAFITRYNPDTLILAGGILVSFALIYFVAPILGISAIIDITTNWGTITNSDYISSNPGRVYITLKRFIFTSLLFSFVVLFVALLALILAGMSEYIMRAYFFIWFPITLVALVMALTSWKLSRRISKEIPVRISVIFAVLLSIAGMALGIRTTSYVDYLQQRIKYSAETPTFSGSSGSLSQTIIVPTLDSPLTGGKNIIWCSSFQLAWNELKDKISKEPIKVDGAQEIADLLNNAKETRNDLDASSYFVASGLVCDGADKYIKMEMSRRFPGESVPEFHNLEPMDLIMYAFLAVQAKFKYPFKDYEDGISFKDSNNLISNVAAFGVWEDKKRFDKQRGQIDVLYQSPLPELESSSEESGENFEEYRSYIFSDMEEYAIDLCKHTEPYQIVLAKIEPKSTLGLTLEDLQSKISDFSKHDDYKDMKVFRKGDTLSVPEMYWEIDHRLKELEGKFVSSPGFGPYPITKANQMIHFRLDRYGAVLKSEVKLIIYAGGSIGRNFSYNKPFLVYMKKRDCEQPFFVMWIDNAELLNKK